MFEITNIFGRISTRIPYKQRSGKFGQIRIYIYSVAKYSLFYTKSLIIYLDKCQLCSYQKDLGRKTKIGPLLFISSCKLQIDIQSLVCHDYFLAKY